MCGLVTVVASLVVMWALGHLGSVVVAMIKLMLFALAAFSTRELPGRSSSRLFLGMTFFIFSNDILVFCPVGTYAE